MELIARDTRQVGTALKRNRQRRKLTQAQLGERMHVRQATVSDLESGESDAQLSTLMDALAALDLELLIRPRTTTSIRDLEDLF